MHLINTGENIRSNPEKHKKWLYESAQNYWLHASSVP